MPNIIMDILTASLSFYKSAQETAELNNLKLISNILAAPYPRDDLQSGLIATLESKIKKFPESNNPPIFRSDSKIAIRELFNLIKIYYNSLATNQDIETISKSFENVKLKWDSYTSLYFTDGFIFSLNKDQKAYNFWTKLRRKITESISTIDGLISKIKASNVESVSSSGTLSI